MPEDEPTLTVSEAGFEMPAIEVLTGRGVVFGKSGSGKSNTVGVLAEELMDHGFPLCIIDAEGEHFGLKEEYELLHVGADDSADVQVGPEHAEALADIMLHDDVPVILDISAYLDEEDARDLVEGVTSHLFGKAKKAKKPFPVFVEEVHEFVPETNSPDPVAQSLIKVAKRGRKHGLGIVGASQRPAEVKKSFVTQSSWSAWHHLTWSQDTSVVAEVIDKEHKEAVQDLDTGEAIIVGDWMDEVRTVQVRRKETFDAGATPGLDEFTVPELKGVSESVVEQLEAVTEEEQEREEEVERLREERDELQAQVEELEDEVSDLRSGDTVESEELDRMADRIESLKAERDSLSDEVDSLEDELQSVREERDALKARVEELEDDLSDVDEAKSSLRDALGALGDPAPEDGVTEDARARIERLEQSLAEVESERDALKRKLEESGGNVVPEDADYIDFIEREPVREAIEDAKQRDNVSPRYVAGVVSSIIEEGGPVTYDEVANRLGVKGTSNISKAATALEAAKVVEKDTSGAAHEVDLNTDGIEDIIAASKKRERTEGIMEDLL